MSDSDFIKSRLFSDTFDVSDDQLELNTLSCRVGPVHRIAGRRATGNSYTLQPYKLQLATRLLGRLVSSSAAPVRLPVGAVGSPRLSAVRSMVRSRASRSAVAASRSSPATPSRSGVILQKALYQPNGHNLVDLDQSAKRTALQDPTRSILPVKVEYSKCPHTWLLI